MDVREAIRGLRAVREFSDEPLPDEVLSAILLAGRRAQSAKNVQPWQFIVVRERATLQALSECGTYAGHLAGAAAAIALVATNEWEYDLGQATAYMMLAAWELGVGSCIATLHESANAKAVLGVPSELRFNVAISFGYPAAGWQPATMGGRRSLDELVHWERWQAR